MEVFKTLATIQHFMSCFKPVRFVVVVNFKSIVTVQKNR